MSETQNESNPESTFGPHRRLEAMFAKEPHIEIKNSAEWAKLDKWRMQREQLMHELTFLGTYENPNRRYDRMTADWHDRQELTELLLDLVAQNRFNPDYKQELFSDANKIENTCGIRLTSSFWSMRAPFESSWQGQYTSNPARLEILRREIEREKASKDQWPLDERAWQWMSAYFHGCCPQNVDIPARQNTEEVLEIFQQDIDLVKELPLSEKDRDEIIRHIKLDFISGRYPIILEPNQEEEDEEMSPYEKIEAEQRSQEVFREMLHDYVSLPSEAFGQIDLRDSAISSLFQRYRSCRSQGLDFAEEMEKNAEASRGKDFLRAKEAERIKINYKNEDAFLSGLSIPEEDREEWRRILMNVAHGSQLKPNAAYRDHVHQHAQWIAENLPQGGKHSERIRQSLYGMLLNYWTGQYYPDSLRWNLLKDQTAEMTGDKKETLSLHQQFIEGSSKDSAKMMVKQDPNLLRSAYENDMRLIKELHLDKETEKTVIDIYNEDLMKGNLPLTPDRESQNEREQFEHDMKLFVSEYKKLELPVNRIEILQKFCDYWFPVSRKPAPRRK